MICISSNDLGNVLFSGVAVVFFLCLMVVIVSVIVKSS